MIHTIDNPKLVKDFFDFKNKQTFTGVVRDKNNNIVYFLNGIYHRTDGPAIEWSDGYKWWFLKANVIEQMDQLLNCLMVINPGG